MTNLAAFMNLLSPKQEESGQPSQQSATDALLEKLRLNNMAKPRVPASDIGPDASGGVYASMLPPAPLPVNTVSDFPDKGGLGTPQELENTVNQANPPSLMSAFNPSPAQIAALKEMAGQIPLQKEGIQFQKDLAKAYAGQPAQLDLSPLAALSDSLSGGKLLAGYQKPNTPGQNLEKISSLYGKSQDERQKLMDNLEKLATASNNQRAITGMLRAEQSQRAGAAKIVPAITNDNIVKAADTQLSSMQKGKELISRIRRGEVPWDLQSKNELESDFAASLNGRAMQGLGTQERQTFTPFEARGANLLGELKGHKINIEDPNAENSYLSQLEASFNGLHDSIGNIRTDRANQLLQNYSVAHAGNPYAENTIGALKKMYAPQAPKNTPVAAPNSQNQAAIDWLKANPNHPDAPAVKKKLGL